MPSNSSIQSPTAPPHIPITKTGVVVRLVSPDHPSRFLIVKPHSKQGDEAPFVLPRGTRMYRDPISGEMVDARDDATALRFADLLEDLLVTATRELEEEAGVPRTMFHARGPIELGRVMYDSPSGKGRYPILWFGVNFLPEDVGKLIPAKDSASVHWMTLEDYRGYVAKGLARAGYVDILSSAEKKLGC